MAGEVNAEIERTDTEPEGSAVETPLQIQRLGKLVENMASSTETEHRQTSSVLSATQTRVAMPFRHLVVYGLAATLGALMADVSFDISLLLGVIVLIFMKIGDLWFQPNYDFS